MAKKNEYWHRNKAEILDGIGRIYLRNNKNESVGIALVDRGDLFRCIIERKWNLCEKTGNVRTNKGGTTTLGKFIAGNMSDGMGVFHKDGNPLNCQRENLCIGSFENQYGSG